MSISEVRFLHFVDRFIGSSDTPQVYGEFSRSSLERLREEPYRDQSQDVERLNYPTRCLFLLK
jgi:hypothetical protein